MLPPDGARPSDRIERGLQRTMRTRLHLKPGRYDPERKKRFKTVELLVGERDWEPRRPPYADDEIGGVRIGFAEADVRQGAK